MIPDHSAWSRHSLIYSPKDFLYPHREYTLLYHFSYLDAISLWCPYISWEDDHHDATRSRGKNSRRDSWPLEEFLFFTPYGIPLYCYSWSAFCSEDRVFPSPKGWLNSTWIHRKKRQISRRGMMTHSSLESGISPSEKNPSFQSRAEWYPKVYATYMARVSWIHWTYSCRALDNGRLDQSSRDERGVVSLRIFACI